MTRLLGIPLALCIGAVAFAQTTAKAPAPGRASSACAQLTQEHIGSAFHYGTPNYQLVLENLEKLRVPCISELELSRSGTWRRLQGKRATIAASDLAIALQQARYLDSQEKSAAIRQEACAKLLVGNPGEEDAFDCAVELSAQGGVGWSVLIGGVGRANPFSPRSFGMDYLEHGDPPTLDAIRRALSEKAIADEQRRQSDQGDACEFFRGGYRRNFEREQFDPLRGAIEDYDLKACLASAPTKHPAAAKFLSEINRTTIERYGLEKGRTYQRNFTPDDITQALEEESAANVLRRLVGALAGTNARTSSNPLWWDLLFLPLDLLLSPFGELTIGSTTALVVWGLVSWWLWWTGLRFAWLLAGRTFGFYNPDNFHRWHWFWLPWRPLGRILGGFSRWKDDAFGSGKGASARWTGLLETLTLVYRPGAIYLGRLWAFGSGWFQPIGISGERHLAMIAGAGSGKTTLLMTLLGLHKGTAFVIDPKGQITRALASRCDGGGQGIRGKNMRTAVLDPFHLVQGINSNSWNPFAEIQRAAEREGHDAAVRFAAKIADGLVIKYANENAFWPGTVRELLTGLILHIHTTEPPEKRTLVRLYELLTIGIPERTQPGANAFSALLREMSSNPAYGGVIAASATTLADTGNDTYGNVLITAREQLQWLKLPEVRAISQRSDFFLEELKNGTLNLFICAPVSDLQQTLSGWFRLLVVMGLYTFECIPGRPKYSCLFALDEFPSLGNIKAIETAAPVMRSYGVRLLAITQDIEKLRQAYPDAWGSFLGNAEAIWWMGTNHGETAAALSQALGSNTRLETVGTWLSGNRVQVSDRAVMDPERLKRFLDSRRGNMIVTRNGRRALRLRNAPYFRELPVYFYEPDPDHLETALRTFTRGLGRKLISASEAVAISSPQASTASATTRGDQRSEAEGPVASTSEAHQHQAPAGPSEESAASESVPNFVLVFNACFGEQGTYPNKASRRTVMAGFSPLLEEGAAFDDLQLRLEKWAIANMGGRTRAEDVIEFFEHAARRETRDV